MMRSWLATTFGAILLVMCLPGLSSVSAALAAPDEDKKETKDHKDNKDHKDGKDAKDHTGHQDKPDDPFKGNLDMTIWSIAVFLVLLTVLWKYAWGPILKGLDKREQTIAHALEHAQKVQADAERLRVELEQKMAQTADQMRSMLEEARRNAQQLKDDLLTEGRAEIQADRDRLRRELQTAQDQALAEIWSQAGRLATMISSKAIRRQLSEDDHRRLVDEALSELRGAAAERQRGQAELS
jgi:F-type H+-transporting ATPase subunit b